MILKIAIKLSLVFSTFLILGCDVLKNDDINSICENSPKLCADFHQIGDCRFKRTTVIRARYYDKIEPTALHQRQLLTELDEYESCLELTLFMEFTRNKERKQQRLDNYLATQALIQRKIKESKQSEDPLLAYYLWTHYQDIQARNKFLAVATKDDVSDPRILFKLANLYAKNDPQEALNQYYKGLHLSKSLDDIPTSTFAMIMTLFYQNKNFEDAYVWALISKEQDQLDEYPINLDLILKKVTLERLN
ncbi:DUF2989 domain-containing protein [Psychromonas sp. KJ10-10]|uniref:DUF2989 domain-containing protein n=1 Tax=Psychromonas sp. KJ10-10 TaxID=3391823 RepID=UPI0039B5DEF8